MSEEEFYVYIYLNPLKPGRYTYGDFISFAFEPFYVGKGKDAQWKSHLKLSKNDKNNIKKGTIKSILVNNLTPIITKLLFNLNEKESYIQEKVFIKLLGRRNQNSGPLANLTDGGEGGKIYNNRNIKLLFEDMCFSSITDFTKELNLPWTTIKYIRKEIIKYNISFEIVNIKKFKFNISTLELISLVAAEKKLYSNSSKRPEIRIKISESVKRYSLENPRTKESCNKAALKIWSSMSKETIIQRNKKISESRKRPIIINNIVYPSITDAMTQLNITYDNIYINLKRGKYLYLTPIYKNQVTLLIQ